MNDWPLDEEANHFARCLLMPEFILRTEAKKLAAGRQIDLLNDQDTFINELAKLFGVPRIAMVLRLHELEIIRL